MASSDGLVYIFQKRLARLLISIPSGYPESKFKSIEGWHKLTNKDRKELEQLNLQKFVRKVVNGETIWLHKKYCEEQIKPIAPLKAPKIRKPHKKPVRKDAPQLDALVESYLANYKEPEPEPAQSDAAVAEPEPVVISEPMPPIDTLPMQRKKTYQPKEGTLVLQRKTEVITSPIAAALLRAGAEVKAAIAEAPKIAPIKGKDPLAVIAARDRTIDGLRKENEALRSKLAEASKLLEEYMRNKRADMIELAHISKKLL